MTDDQLVSEVHSKLTGEDKASHLNREYLQKYASLLVLPQVDVQYEDVQTAYCMENDGYKIRITDSEFATDGLQMSDRAYTLLVQEGLLYHELGHVLYTDFAAMEDVAETVDVNQRQHFQNFYNVFEDVVIEVYLRQEFNCSEILHLTNRHFIGQDAPEVDPATMAQPEQAQAVGMYYGRFGRESYSEISDELVAETKQKVSEFVQTSDARERVTAIRNWWQELTPERFDSNNDFGSLDGEDMSHLDGGEQEKDGMDVPIPDELSGSQSGDSGDDNGDNESDSDSGGSGGDGEEVSPEYSERVEKALTRYDSDELQVIMNE